jgi:hypothetical protein
VLVLSASLGFGSWNSHLREPIALSRKLTVMAVEIEIFLEVELHFGSFGIDVNVCFREGNLFCGI